jgi:hypothetical protein
MLIIVFKDRVVVDLSPHLSGRLNDDAAVIPARYLCGMLK